MDAEPDVDPKALEIAQKWEWAPDLARAITALLREREQVLANTPCPECGHPLDINEMLKHCNLLDKVEEAEAKLREREEEIGRLKALVVDRQRLEHLLSCRGGCRPHSASVPKGEAMTTPTPDTVEQAAREFCDQFADELLIDKGMEALTALLREQREAARREGFGEGWNACATDRDNVNRST
jgi:hypothetical protein